jgi:hypothetical protein
MKVEAFKKDLGQLTADQVFDRWMLTGSCEVIDDDAAHAIGDSIAAQFTVEYRDIVYVGSASLGFSIKPARRYKPFGEDSDVDVAIVSRDLFERVWREIYAYDRSGAYWPERASFRKYLVRGWIRPDLLPPSELFDFANEWWPFFNELRIDGCPYKVAAGIYHSHYFLREYQKVCIEQCQMEL